MSKAYDRVEWPYLEAMMRKMGFSDQWIKLPMLRVTSVSYSILVNEEAKDMIHPLRGIQQGDPLSPFLFLLCTKGLHSLINKAASQGDIQGYSFGRYCLRIIHLLFADDSQLFCKATIQECQMILDILDTYGTCSRQKINKSKTTSFFLASPLLKKLGITLNKHWVFQK